MVREGLLTFEQRLVRYVRREDMKTVGKVEGILSTKSCGLAKLIQLCKV